MDWFVFVAIITATIFTLVFKYEPDKDWQYWVIIFAMCLCIVEYGTKTVAN